MEPIPYEIDMHLRQHHPVVIKFIEDHWHSFFSHVLDQKFHAPREAAAYAYAKSFLAYHISQFDKIALFGCGVLGIRIANLCADLGKPVKWFIDSHLSRIESDFMGKPLLAPEQLAGISPDLVIITSISHGNTMASVARRHLGGGINLFSFADNGSRSLSSKGFKEVMRDINHLTVANPEKTIVFCCRSFNFNQTKLVQHLKDKGYTTLLVTFSSLINGAMDIDAISSLFDYLYLPSTYREFLNVLRNISPALIHYTGYMFHGHDAMLARLCSHVPFIFEYNDITSLAFNRDRYAALRKDQAADIEYWCERYLCENADGIILQDSQNAMKALSDRYTINAPMLQFQSYVTYAITGSVNRKAKRKRRRLVYAGGIHSSIDYQNDGYYLTRSLLEIVPAITEQGFQFDVYNCYDHNGIGYDEFIALADRNPFFNYHRPVLAADLPAILSQYDYAWYGFDFSKTVASKQFYGECFGSKFWSYVEAGLPIIISREHEYMTQLAVDLGIGIPFDMSALQNLSHLIDGYNYREMRANVRQAQKAYSMERQLDRLLLFYKKAGLYALAKKKLDSLIKLEESYIGDE